MGWSISIGSIAHTAIRIHVTFLLFLAWIFFASYVAGGADAAWSSLIFMVLLFACVLAHEFGHILTARLFGVSTPDVTLLPIGGVARLERIPEKPSEEFFIAIAGPLVNIVIALGLLMFAGAGISATHLSAMESNQIAMIDRLATINLALALFNLIPAFPMDGGRVLRALLAAKLGHIRATEVAAAIGQAFAFALGLIGLLTNPLLIFIAIFVYLAAASEAQLVALRAISRDVPVSAAMITQFEALRPDAHIDEAVQILLHTSQGETPVIDNDGRPIGVLGRDNLVRALKQLGPEARVAEAMTTPIATVNHRGCLDEAFRLLQEGEAPAVAVVDASGILVGLITPETVAEMLMVDRAMPTGMRLGPWNRPTAS